MATDRCRRGRGQRGRATFALPLRLNIVVAIVAAVAAGLVLETARGGGAATEPGEEHP